MHDGCFFAVIFAGNHDAKFVVDLKENDRPETCAIYETRS